MHSMGSTHGTAPSSMSNRGHRTPAGTQLSPPAGSARKLTRTKATLKAGGLLCRGTLPSTLVLPNVQVLQATQLGVFWNASHDQKNSRGQNLPEYLTFDP